jgi:RalA-binding protein 1
MRANSELGHYSDLQDQRDGWHSTTSPERHRPRERKVFQPTLNTVVAMPNTPGQDLSQDNVPTPRADVHGKAKISGPLGGTVIPAGYKFGGKDAPAETTPSAADRREKAKSRSFWGFGKNDKQPPPTSQVPRAVFGVTLEESLDVVEIANLPAVVFRCIQYLEAKKADQEEGIYRLSGSSAVIKSLKDRFNAEGDVDLLSSDEYWDPHAIAGLLKSYLRELPASILTRDLHLRFLSVIDFVDPQERIKELSHLIASLPIANYSLLRALTAHLILIVQNAGVNKMTMRNVGIVFSPTLGIPAGVFSLMLGEFNRVFNVDAGGDDDNGEGDHSSAAEDPIRRNSRQYSDAAADQLLGLSGRSLTASVEEGQSDADSISVDYESGPESTEEGATVESSARSSPGAGHHDRAYTDYGVPSTPKASKASSAAATRGLNIAISNRGNRHSRIMLPGSPRPGLSPNDPSPPVAASPMHTLK